MAATAGGKAGAINELHRDGNYQRADETGGSEMKAATKPDVYAQLGDAIKEATIMIVAAGLLVIAWVVL